MADVILTCKFCGKCLDMQKWKRYGLNYMLKSGKGKFCSRDCYNKWQKGHHNSRKTEFVKNDIRLLKENHPQWKGGKWTNKHGYILALNPEHPYCDSNGYIMEHRLVMEKHLNRYLKPEEVIHHINRIKNDNRIKNLKLFNNHSEHTSFEMKLIWERRKNVT